MPLSQYLVCIKFSSWLVNSLIIYGNTIHLRGFCKDVAMQTDTNIFTKRRDSFIYTCCNQNILLSLSFHSQQTREEHEERESEQHVWVPPPGAPYLARAPGRVLCPVPGLAPDHRAGQSAHCPAHQAGCSPPHLDVLPSQPLGPHWHLFHLSPSLKCW